MIDDLELLNLQSPVGKGQENEPSDVAALDDRLRKIGAYSPPPEYSDNPQRYATEPMIGALERYQEQNGLKVDGVAKPGGPTERAINNHLLEKPRGAGLLYDPPTALARRVGNGFENRPSDVVSVKRKLGALGYGSEDPFDRPSGFIEETTTDNIKAFQRAKGLTEDGWLGPNGETERALNSQISNLSGVLAPQWLAFAERARRAQQSYDTHRHGPHGDTSQSSNDDIGEVVPARIPGGISFAPPSAPPAVGPGERLIYINPRYVPQPRLNFRAPLPGDLKWVDPKAPPPFTPRPPIRLGSPTSDDEQISTDDLPRALGRPPEPSLAEEARRALTIPRRPTTEPEIYAPEPGSPLRIPIIDSGIQGDPRTIQTTKAITNAIKKACEEVFGKENVSFKEKMERHYPGDQKGTTKGSSFADEWVGMTVTAADFTLNFVSDSYTSRVDGSPIADEERRFAKLEYNRRHGRHEITVRVPKVWKFGQTLNNEKLYDAAKEVCEQIKKMIDEGEIGKDHGWLRITKMLDDLVKPKKPPKPEPRELSDP